MVLVLRTHLGDTCTGTYIWSSCPNSMLSHGHWGICYSCCFRIFSKISGEQFRTIWLTFVDNESFQLGFSDFLTLRRLDN